MAAACVAAVGLWMEEKRITVFTPQSNFSITVVEREGHEYVSLNDVLERLGTLNAVPGDNKVMLRFNSLEAEFEDGSGEVKISGNSIDTGEKVLVEQSRVLVRLTVLPPLLTNFVNQPVDYHKSSRRLFLGEVGTRFALELKKAESTQLVVTFNAPVSPQISTEPGKLRLVFGRDPVAMEPQNWQFDDAVITSASFSEAAEPELTVSGNQPLLATFADGGRTIAIVPAPVVQTQAAESASSSPTATPSGQLSPSREEGPPPTPVAGIPTPAVASGRTRYLIVLDAGHGGSERGAALTAKLAEKDVTLAIAHRLREELKDRGITSVMPREGDNTVSLEQRAVLANTSQAAVYIAIHAGGLGRGVRVYTSMLSPADVSAGVFQPWEKAQARFVPRSKLVASAILGELGKNQIRAPSAMLPAPVRPLNNITAAAVALEVAPLRDDVETLNNENYQRSIAVSVASALAAIRSRIEPLQ